MPRPAVASFRLRTCLADGCGTETQWAKRPRSAQTSPVVELPGECRSFVERDPRSRRPQTLRQTGSEGWARGCGRWGRLEALYAVDAMEACMAGGNGRRS